LTAPLALRDACQILREIIAVYDTSLVDESDRASNDDFDKLLEKAVVPSVEMCERMADLRKGVTAWDKDIFLINCLGYLQVSCQYLGVAAANVTAAYPGGISLHGFEGGHARREEPATRGVHDI